MKYLVFLFAIGCSSSQPVITRIHQAPSGKLSVETSDLEVSGFGPFIAVDKMNCRRSEVR